MEFMEGDLSSVEIANQVLQMQELEVGFDLELDNIRADIRKNRDLVEKFGRGREKIREAVKKYLNNQ